MARSQNKEGTDRRADLSRPANTKEDAGKSTRKNHPRQTELRDKIAAQNYALRTEPIREAIKEQEHLFGLLLQKEEEIVALVSQAIADELFPYFVTELWEKLNAMAREDKGLRPSELRRRYKDASPLAEFKLYDDDPGSMAFSISGYLPRWETITGIYSILLGHTGAKPEKTVKERPSCPDTEGASAQPSDYMAVEFFRCWIDKITDFAKKEELLRLDQEAREIYDVYVESLKKAGSIYRTLPWSLQSPIVSILSPFSRKTRILETCEDSVGGPLVQGNGLMKVLHKGRFLNLQIDLHRDRKTILNAVDNLVDRAQKITGKSPSKGRIDAMTIAVRDLVEVYLFKYYVDGGLSKEKTLMEISDRFKEIGKELSEEGIQKRHLQPILDKHGVKFLKELRTLKKTPRPGPLP